jgi:hypothetical protein
MDGKFHTLVSVVLGKGKEENSSFQPTTNALIFFTIAPSSHAYCAFTTTFEDLEAPYFCRETVLQYPGCRNMNNKALLLPEEFVPKETINFCKDMVVNEGANADNAMVKTSNLPTPLQEEDPTETIQQGPLIFSSSPLLEQGEDTKLATANEQAELLQWHYRLGYMCFTKLKQHAFNEKKTRETCQSCAAQVHWLTFWHNDQESLVQQRDNNSHKVFNVTKLGEYVFVCQEISTRDIANKHSLKVCFLLMCIYSWMVVASGMSLLYS